MRYVDKVIPFSCAAYLATKRMINNRTEATALCAEEKIWIRKSLRRIGQAVGPGVWCLLIVDCDIVSFVTAVTSQRRHSLLGIDQSQSRSQALSSHRPRLRCTEHGGQWPHTTLPPSLCVPQSVSDESPPTQGHQVTDSLRGSVIKQAWLMSVLFSVGYESEREHEFYDKKKAV